MLPGHGHFRVQVFSLVEAVVFTALYVASRPDRRRVIDVLRLAGATDAQTAMARSELASNLSKPLERLVREGIVIVTPDGQVYLDRQRADAQTDTPRIVGLIILGAVAAIAGVWLMF